MRWYILSGIVLLALAVTESSMLPAALENTLRPSLVLIVSAVWASLRGSDGFAWALAGGLLLDLMSSVPLGLTSLSLLMGNAVASLLDRAPIPSRLFRTTTWVAIVTVVAHGITLIGLSISGRVIDVSYAMATVILPLLLLNPVLSIPVYVLLNGVQMRLRRQQAVTGTGSL
jgi:rod shape-determining protein MreD